MTAPVRAAMTQAVNAYPDMPAARGELGQLAGRLGEVREANLRHHLGLMDTAAAAGARVVCFGELFTGPYFALEERAVWRDLAEPVEDGPTVRALAAAAARHRMVVVAPLYELAGEKRYNTAAVLDADGRLLGKYRKTHIPRGANEQGAFFETFYYGPSDEPLWDPPPGGSPYFPVFDTAVGKLGVMICYDRHFEGVTRSLKAGGAELVFCPAVTFGARSRRMWDLEFAADAGRHRLFIGGSNRAGAEPPWGQPYYGATHFVGPDGPVPDRSAHPELVVADLDLAALGRGDGAGWDLPRDRRGAIYAG